VIFSDDACEDAHGRLLAEGVEVRHVADEAGIPALCQRQMVGRKGGRVTAAGGCRTAESLP
jgi:hypothetical protein